MADIQDRRNNLVFYTTSPIEAFKVDLPVGNLARKPEAKGNVIKYFQPLTSTLKLFGFFLEDVEAHDSIGRFFVGIVRFFQLIYAIGMWAWTILMSINIYYLAIVVTAASGLNPTNNLRANMIVTLVEESPYSFITIRNAVILTTFFSKAGTVKQGILGCEKLCQKISLLTGTGEYRSGKSSFHPAFLLTASIFLISLWEIYEWYIHLTLMGTEFLWNMQPFPFHLYHYIYASLWLIFTTIPFFLSQIALCFPVCFAYQIRSYCTFLNRELVLLTKHADLPGVDFAKRVTELRRLHLDVKELLHQVDKGVRRILLQQFIFDVIILFGFVGLLVNSKDCMPRKPTIEWTFFIATSLFWFLFFLVFFSVPLIQMAGEGEKTYRLVQALSMTPKKLNQESFNDIALFMEESRSPIAFTGDNFYYVNRHYIVTCIALVASYIIVLAEVLERFYGTEHLKEEIGHLSQVIMELSHNFDLFKLTPNLTSSTSGHIS